MSISLHSATVAAYLQILPQVASLVAKAEAHCTENGLPPETLTDARLAPDMWPFAKQVFECGHHSSRAIAAVRAGVFGPEHDPAPLDFASLHHQVADAIAMLESVTREEIDSLVGRDMRFEFGTYRMEFTVEDFLLSFSLPNFYFHATSAYAILRNQGLAVGKLDYLGKVRLKA